MKLFYSPGACSLASHIVLHETGLKFEAFPVNTKDKTWKGGDFKKINSKGYVPALQLDNGEVLTEGVAIMQYLADQKPEAKLIPKAGTFERYRCQEWLNYISTEVHKGFSPLWNPKTPDAAKPVIKENLAARFDWLSTQMKNNSFLMGNQFTVADAYLFTILSWAPHVQIDLSKWPALMGFTEKVKNRPATMAALKAEGLVK